MRLADRSKSFEMLLASVDDLLGMSVGKQVLSFASFKMLGGVDKQDIIGSPAFS